MSQATTKHIIVEEIRSAEDKPPGLARPGTLKMLPWQRSPGASSSYTRAAVEEQTVSQLIHNPRQWPLV